MSPRPRLASPTTRRRTTPLLAPDVDRIDLKDVDLLRRFVTDRGKVRARRITGITPRQQRQVARAVKTAREMALLPYPGHPRGRQ